MQERTPVLNPPFSFEFRMLWGTAEQEAGTSGVSGVEIRSAGQQYWTKLDMAWGANWQTSSAGAAPFDLRLTPRDGSPQLVSLCAP